MYCMDCCLKNIVQLKVGKEKMGSSKNGTQHTEDVYTASKELMVRLRFNEVELITVAIKKKGNYSTGS